MSFTQRRSLHARNAPKAPRDGPAPLRRESPRLSHLAVAAPPLFSSVGSTPLSATKTTTTTMPPALPVDEGLPSPFPELSPPSVSNRGGGHFASRVRTEILNRSELQNVVVVDEKDNNGAVHQDRHHPLVETTCDTADGIAVPSSITVAKGSSASDSCITFDPNDKITNSESPSHASPHSLKSRPPVPPMILRSPQEFVQCPSAPKCSSQVFAGLSDRLPHLGSGDNDDMDPSLQLLLQGGKALNVDGIAGAMPCRQVTPGNGAAAFSTCGEGNGYAYHHPMAAQRSPSSTAADSYEGGSGGNRSKGFTLVSLSTWRSSTANPDTPRAVAQQQEEYAQHEEQQDGYTHHYGEQQQDGSSTVAMSTPSSNSSDLNGQSFPISDHFRLETRAAPHPAAPRRTVYFSAWPRMRADFSNRRAQVEANANETTAAMVEAQWQNWTGGSLPPTGLAKEQTPMRVVTADGAPTFPQLIMQAAGSKIPAVGEKWFWGGVRSDRYVEGGLDGNWEMNDKLAEQKLKKDYPGCNVYTITNQRELVDRAIIEARFDQLGTPRSLSEASLLPDHPPGTARGSAQETTEEDDEGDDYQTQNLSWESIFDQRIVPTSHLMCPQTKRKFKYDPTTLAFQQISKFPIDEKKREPKTVQPPDLANSCLPTAKDLQRIGRLFRCNHCGGLNKRVTPNIPLCQCHVSSAHRLWIAMADCQGICPACLKYNPSKLPKAVEALVDAVTRVASHQPPTEAALRASLSLASFSSESSLSSARSSDQSSVESHVEPQGLKARLRSLTSPADRDNFGVVEITNFDHQADDREGWDFRHQFFGAVATVAIPSNAGVSRVVVMCCHCAEGSTTTARRRCCGESDPSDHFHPDFGDDDEKDQKRSYSSSGGGRSSADEHSSPRPFAAPPSSSIFKDVRCIVR